MKIEKRLKKLKRILKPKHKTRRLKLIDSTMKKAVGVVMFSIGFALTVSAFPIAAFDLRFGARIFWGIACSALGIITICLSVP